MKNYSEDVLPRERFLKYGVEALSHQELLAIILRTGSKNKDVMSLSLELLHHFESLFELKAASLEELTDINGIGPVKAMELQATIELGRRFSLCHQIKLGQIVSSQAIGEQLVLEMSDYQQEHLMALYLNSKNEMIKKDTIFIGSVNQSIAHPREIFRGAVKCSAARMILAHNHPSGNPAPSQQDERFTSRLIECGKLMGIDILDHLVIGNKSYVSFKETGRI